MKCDVAAEDLCNALFGSGAAIRHGLQPRLFPSGVLDREVVFSTKQMRTCIGFDTVPPADVVILAGDTGVGLKGMRWARENFRGRTVIYIAGNHEYYCKAIPRYAEKVRDAAKVFGIHFLENESIVLDGVAFLGRRRAAEVTVRTA